MYNPAGQRKSMNSNGQVRTYVYVHQNFVLWNFPAIQYACLIIALTMHAYWSLMCLNATNTYILLYSVAGCVGNIIFLLLIMVMMVGVEQGVRQVWVMSLWLFNLFMDTIVREARRSLMGEWNWKKQQCSTALICWWSDAHNREGWGCGENLRMPDEVMDWWRRQINWKKKKVLTVKWCGSTCDMLEEVKTCN